MAKYVMAIDQGTTSTRAMIFDHESNVVAWDQKEHEQIYPQPGWVEHNPMEIWERTQEVVKNALAKAGISGSDIVAIGVTNQRETTIVWNKRTGKPYYNAIVWQDTRTAPICAQLQREGYEATYREKTGLPIATYFSGPKIQWILDNVPGVREDAEKGEALFGNIDTWLIWWLTGGPDGGAHVTDVSNASRTMLMNLRTLDWDDDILKIHRIPRQMLPQIRPSSDPHFYGKTPKSGLLGAEVPVCGDLGDQQAALVGQAGLDVGMAKNTYGTGCFLLLNTGTNIVPSKSGLLTTVAYQFGDGPCIYALEGSIAITGALVQWLRDNLGLIKTSAEVEDLARTVEDNGGIYFVPFFSGAFAPYWRLDARGVIVGLTRYINKGHLARAVLEATAYQTRDVFDAMYADSGIRLAELRVDGGMVRNELLMQFQADILGVPVVRPVIQETTSLGAAYAAGMAVGFWSGPEQIRQYWKEDKRWLPKMDPETREKLYAGWKKAVERSFGWVEF